MKRLLAILLASVCAFPANGFDGAEFRGYSAVNQVVFERLIRADAPFELGHYVGQSYDPVFNNLLDLLGSYKSISSGGVFRNGVPNALNMLLYHMLFSGLARDVGKICDGENLVFNDELVAAVMPLCVWPLNGSHDEAVLRTFWTVIMNFDAPESEYAAWREFALSEEMDSFKSSEAVEWLTLSVLMNPYFLLRR